MLMDWLISIHYAVKWVKEISREKFARKNRRGLIQTNPCPSSGQGA